MNHSNWNRKHSDLISEQNELVSTNDNNFKDMFSLQTVSNLNYNKDNYMPDKNFSQYSNDKDHTLGVIPSDQFNKHLKPDLGSYRDKSVIIKDYHSGEVGQYARKKIEIPQHFEPFKNNNAMAGSNEYLQNLNELKNTNLKNIDGDLQEKNLLFEKPLEYKDARIMPKTLEQRRGFGVNNQRLDPRNRIQTTGQKSEGQSINPDDIILTKNKKQTWREQQPGDVGVKGGYFQKSEYRGLIQNLNTNRTNSMEVVGIATNLNSQPELRNNQEARTTIRQQTEETNYVGHSNKNSSGNYYKNNQEARDTIRQQTEETNYVGHSNKNSSGNYYNNHQQANQTIREQMGETNYVGHSNKNSSGNYYNNHQQANQTIRENTGETNYIGHSNKNSSGNYYHNQQQANQTIRENTGETNYTGISNKNSSGNYYNNQQPANETIRQVTGETNYSGHSNNFNTGHHYRNNQQANDTIREDTSSEFVGGSYSYTTGHAYENQQPANMTVREHTAENDKTGPSFKSQTYTKSGDKTRPKNLVHVRDYKGIKSSNTTGQTSRIFQNNFESDERTEKSIDMTNRKLIGGGKDQLSASVKDIGEFSDRSRIPSDKVVHTNPESLISQGYKYHGKTRGKSKCLERQKIDENITVTLDGNPYINNMVHKSLSEFDTIRDSTIMNSRDIEEIKY